MPDRTLELTRLANEHLALANEALARAAAARIRAGEALIRAKGKVDPADWEQWQLDNLNFSPEVAAEYMELAQASTG